MNKWACPGILYRWNNPIDHIIIKSNVGEQSAFMLQQNQRAETGAMTITRLCL